MAVVSRRELLFASTAVAGSLALSSSSALAENKVVAQMPQLPENDSLAISPTGLFAQNMLLCLCPANIATCVKRPVDSFLSKNNAHEFCPETGFLCEDPENFSEIVSKSSANIILDVGSESSSSYALASAAGEALSIPVIAVDGTIGNIPEAFRKMGKAFDCESRASRLADYCEDSLALAFDNTGLLKNSRVFYGEGVTGFTIRSRDSHVAKLFSLLGADYVSHSGFNGEADSVDFGYVIKSKPDIIFLAAPACSRRCSDKSSALYKIWNSIRLETGARLFILPALACDWIALTPLFVQSLGVRWILNCLSGSAINSSFNQDIDEFKKLFIDEQGDCKAQHG